MARRSVQVELQEVPLTTRFRKFSGGRRDKVRERAKIEVVQTGADTFGVTVKRGITSVKKGKVAGGDLTVASVRAAVRRDIKAGKYDSALFDGYDRIMAAKKAKKKR
jgi:hypothetical protein